jgi:hypothetical protein
MRDWIAILILYVLALGLFRILGGLGSAAEAFRRWGGHTAANRINPGSSS